MEVQIFNRISLLQWQSPIKSRFRFISNLKLSETFEGREIGIEIRFTSISSSVAWLKTLIEWDYIKLLPCSLGGGRDDNKKLKIEDIFQILAHHLDRIGGSHCLSSTAQGQRVQVAGAGLLQWSFQRGELAGGTNLEWNISLIYSYRISNMRPAVTDWR